MVIKILICLLWIIMANATVLLVSKWLFNSDWFLNLWGHREKEDESAS